MSNEEKKPEVLLSINYIKEISFFVNEGRVINEQHLPTNERKEILVQMTAIIAFNLIENIVKFTPKAWYHYKDSPEAELASIEVENTFKIVDLKNFINKDNKIDFPSGTWVSIVSLSISHTRALFTKHLAGTALQMVMMPIMNPYDVAKQYFPESFEKIPTESVEQNKVKKVPKKGRQNNG